MIHPTGAAGCDSRDLRLIGGRRCGNRLRRRLLTCRMIRRLCAHFLPQKPLGHLDDPLAPVSPREDVADHLPADVGRIGYIRLANAMLNQASLEACHRPHGRRVLLLTTLALPAALELERPALRGQTLLLEAEPL